MGGSRRCLGRGGGGRSGGIGWLRTGNKLFRRSILSEHSVEAGRQKGFESALKIDLYHIISVSYRM